MAPKSTFDDKYVFNPLAPSNDDLASLSLERDKGIVYRYKRQVLHVEFLHLAIGVLNMVGGFVAVFRDKIFPDRSLAIWSPANGAMEYRTVTFTSYLFNRSPYLGTLAEEKDALWAKLYDFGISGLSESEALHLLKATLPAPNYPSKYVVQLEVFHLLHCLDRLRKAIYPDEYPGGWTYDEDGTVNHNSITGLHWDHCIDALRQAIMCSADVTPVTFIHNNEGDYNIFPKLSATHTCRNSDAVVEWAKRSWVMNWRWRKTSQNTLPAYFSHPWDV